MANKKGKKKKASKKEVAAENNAPVEGKDNNI
jgi:hypothetical protein